MTLKIGITGGIGSGKSVVCHIFSLLGVPVFNSDLEGRSILENDSRVIASVKTIFGADAYSADGEPDRKKIAALAFSDAEKLKKLNAVIHPAVNERFSVWLIQHAAASYVIKEAAILVESGSYKELDYLVLVSAPEELKQTRAAKRDNLSPEQVAKRSRNQMNETELAEYVQFVIRNDEKELLIPQVMKLHEFFLAESAKRNA
jgi:dephospho-CoA kinase